ncbi:MAG: UDP-3-O-(3-hydroxymyristoyl)glucosamine N-acyltransferase [Proteobacteria bacterium]|nr:UDP-3-O-(3-hydroxymyristoyl)glucosamine N-acyltransferase [Cystobacterineae bacterium]MCL2259521.1 UDP-3-O-(3-hydroxymyristoyl)glucosamine N-acyltransferase [Cystobacterineae bacterium]MCL2314000.1 UDP-3-O-(3-hydroxymyristoyl)glucosamine N-acyltransferase [Pseudomonadota bacterium]
MNASKTLGEIAQRIGGKVEGDVHARVGGVASLEAAGKTQLSYFANPRYRKALLGTQALAVIAREDAPHVEGMNWIRVANPALAFAQVADWFNPRTQPPPGVDKAARIHPEACIHPSACIMANVVIEKGAVVGAHTVLFPGVFIGEGVVLGEGCWLYPNVVVMDKVEVGNRVTIYAGAVLGADGFGYVFDVEKKAHVKIPQTGVVHIEDDVEIGAGTCIDRATTGETVIGRGTKIDNLVQIGHNVHIGPLGLICGQVGIAGSTTIGAGVVLAGQVGIADHVEIGNRVMVSAQTGIGRDVEDGAQVSGYSGFRHVDWLKFMLSAHKLPELLKEVGRLKRRIEELEKEENL